MKKTYENFTEIGEDFVTGENWTHALSDHKIEDCSAWQHGVLEFSKWLDEIGLKIIENPEIYDKLWEKTRIYKPEKLIKLGG